MGRRTFAGFGQTVKGKTTSYESTVNYTLDAGNRLTQAVDSLAGTMTRGYDNLDRMTSEGTPQGSVSYTYNNAARRASMTVAGQTAVSYTYDTASRLTGLSYALGATTLGNLTYSYDNAGRRTNVGGSFARMRLPLAISSATYDTANAMFIIKDPRGIVYLTNLYDSNGRVSKQTQADSTTFQFAYTLDSNGKVTQTNLTDPRGIVRVVSFNSNRYTVTDTYASGKPEQETTTYAWQTANNLISSLTDLLNRQSTYT